MTKDPYATRPWYQRISPLSAGMLFGLVLGLIAIAPLLYLIWKGKY